MHKMTVWVLNGPNLNFLGIREPEIYGTNTYADLKRCLRQCAADEGIRLRVRQSNSEGKLIDWIQAGHRRGIDGMLINPGALTHYSYSLRDAIASVAYPVAEVHLTDTSTREDFRSLSLIREVTVLTEQGEGFASYEKALRRLKQGRFDRKKSR